MIDYSVPIRPDGQWDYFELAKQLLSTDIQRALVTCRLCGAFPVTTGHRCVTPNMEGT
jgi:hypothetical protein